ncbi:MAG TPA: hypothetical protein VIT89_00440 [Solirubrobacterales bacterium]
MKYLKMLGIAAVAAMSFMAFAAASASATTLEVEGVTQNKTVFITASLTPGNSAVLSRTDGSLANTCTESHVEGHTIAPFTVPTTGEITGTVETLSFTGCTRPVTVHKPGLLHISHETGTTNGTVTSSEAEVTVGSPFGTLVCKTGTGTHIGTMTGATTASNPGKHAEIHINAVLNCGFLVPSAKWSGTYIVTTPTELGVSA